MKTKCTPKPWATLEGYDASSGLKLTRVLFGTSIVAECYGINSEANARLIAAAPELLEALLAAHHMLTRDYIDPAKMIVVEKCSDAIELATGEQL